jgi:hypothetical protein
VNDADVKSFQYVAIDGMPIYIYVDVFGKRSGVNGTVSTKIENMQKKYPEINMQELNKALENAIVEYEKKYPGYEPNQTQPPTQPTIFPDIPPTHPLYEVSKKAHEAGWLTGYPDGEMKPDNLVNRAEFAKMLVGNHDLKDSSDDLDFLKEILGKYPDVNLQEWYASTLAQMVERKIMEGYGDGTIKPGNTINKAEALKMNTLISSPDLSQYGDEPWYEKYRLYTVKKYPTLGFIAPDRMGEEMTRGEAVRLIVGE